MISFNKLLECLPNFEKEFSQSVELRVPFLSNLHYKICCATNFSAIVIHKRWLWLGDPLMFWSDHFDGQLVAIWSRTHACWVEQFGQFSAERMGMTIIIWVHETIRHPINVNRFGSMISGSGQQRMSGSRISDLGTLGLWYFGTPENTNSFSSAGDSCCCRRRWVIAKCQGLLYLCQNGKGAA